MSLHPLYGHAHLRERLAGAAKREQLPSSLLFHGPPGVGKQRLALWLGQLLQCERVEACGSCRGCRLARRLEHPDLHWFFPLPRPGGTSSREKLRERLEASRMEAMDAIREDPLHPPEHEGATGIYLAAVDEMRAMASRRPAMGPRAVFVVGNADAMVPQAASPQAANAFLKLLEEPPRDTFVVLTSSRRGALLPTVRSRVAGVRVPPLPTDEVEAFLRQELEIDPAEAGRVARRSQGSIGRALHELDDEGRRARDEAARLVRAALSDRPGRRLSYAAGVGPTGARGGYSDLLARVRELLRDLLALSLDQREAAFDPDGAEKLLQSRSPPSPHGILGAIDHLEEAREEASGNVNPQAITAVLLGEMARALAVREDGRERNP
ncbi:MAG: ATP-binding protein [Gemmatimonadota bacterium]